MMLKTSTSDLAADCFLGCRWRGHIQQNSRTKSSLVRRILCSLETLESAIAQVLCPLEWPRRFTPGADTRLPNMALKT